MAKKNTKTQNKKIEEIKNEEKKLENEIINDLEENENNDDLNDETSNNTLEDEIVQDLEEDITEQKEVKFADDDSIIEKFFDALDKRPELTAKLKYKIDNLVKTQEEQDYKTTKVKKLDDNTYITEIIKSFRHYIRNQYGVVENYVDKVVVKTTADDEIEMSREEFLGLDVAVVQIIKENSREVEVEIGEPAKIRTDEGVYTGETRGSVQKLVVVDDLEVKDIENGNEFKIKTSAIVSY